MKNRRQKNKATSVRTGETPTQERRKQNGGVLAEIMDRASDGKALVKRFKAYAECTLDAYFLRNVITEYEYKAGMRFRTAYLRAVLRVRVDDISSGNHGDFQASALMPVYSEQLLREAYEVLSPLQKSAIINVCGHDQWAGNAAKLKTLHRGLEKLADLWKLA